MTSSRAPGASALGCACAGGASAFSALAAGGGSTAMGPTGVCTTPAPPGGASETCAAAGLTIPASKTHASAIPPKRVPVRNIGSRGAIARPFYRK